MRQLKVTVIALCFCFTVSSQSDSLDCFTPSQVKTFLRTKVELNNCLGEFNRISVANDALTATNAELVDSNVKLDKKMRRNRRIAIGEGIGLAGLIVLIFTVK